MKVRGRIAEQAALLRRWGTGSPARPSTDSHPAYVRAFDRTAEWYQHLSDQVGAATAATRARGADRDRVRDQGWER